MNLMPLHFRLFGVLSPLFAHMPLTPSSWPAVLAPTNSQDLSRPLLNQWRPSL